MAQARIHKELDMRIIVAEFVTHLCETALKRHAWQMEFVQQFEFVGMINLIPLLQSRRMIFALQVQTLQSAQEWIGV